MRSKRVVFYRVQRRLRQYDGAVLELWLEVPADARPVLQTYMAAIGTALRAAGYQAFLVVPVRLPTHVVPPYTRLLSYLYCSLSTHSPDGAQPRALPERTLMHSKPPSTTSAL